MINTVILTCIGGNLGAENVRLCQQAGARVIGVNASLCMAAHEADEFALVPGGGARDYVERMLELVRNHGVGLIIPGSDEEALTLARHKPMFEQEGALIACVDSETLDVLNDKGQTYKALADSGVRLAEWHKVGTQAGMLDVVDEMVARLGSVVVKPAGARGGRGVFVIDRNGPALETRVGGREIFCNQNSFKHLARVLSKEDFPLIVMERLYPPHHDLDLLAWQGEAIGIVPRKWHQFPNLDHGIEVIEAPELISMGKEIVKQFNLSWLYDIDLMKNSNGEWRLLEINPRMSGSVSVLGSLGVNMFEHLLALANGKKTEFIPPKIGNTVASEHRLIGSNRGQVI
jgi:carbamoyl-phosphate synthase large subunit